MPSYSIKIKCSEGEKFFWTLTKRLLVAVPPEQQEDGARNEGLITKTEFSFLIAVIALLSIVNIKAPPGLSLHGIFYAFLYTNIIVNYIAMTIIYIVNIFLGLW